MQRQAHGAHAALHNRATAAFTRNLLLFRGHNTSHPRQLCCSALSDSGSHSSPEQLLQQLGSQLSQQQPHFGTKLTQQLLQQAESLTHQAGSVVQQHLPTELQQLTSTPLHLPAPPQLTAVSLPSLQDISLPSLPDVQLPNVQIPELHAPAVQLPSISLADFKIPDGQALLQAVSEASANAANLPDSIHQQLVLMQQQLLLLASSTNAPLQPHFGTQAVLAWLQEAQQTLSSALHLPMLQLPAAQSITWHSVTDNLSSSLHNSPISIAGTSAESINASILAATTLVAHSLPEAVSSWLTSSGLQQADIAVPGWQQLQESLLQLQQALLLLPEQGMGGYDLPTLCFLAAGTIAATAASATSLGASAAADADDISDTLSYEYDAEAVAAYFKKRPVLVAQRSVQLALELTGFGLALLIDVWTNRLQVNEAVRAEQLRSAIERLGPAYVKVAQALSTRVDLLSPEYFKQVQLLQDRVPPFPCEQAKEVMAKAFGRPVEDVFVTLSSKPVAAASLGQVYKGRLREEYGGGEVAVKVQRPDVLEQVCLDLHLMRQAAETISALPEVRTNWASLIDNWAVRFLHEMDYTREAANARLFRDQMAAAGVTGIVTADVIDNLSTDFVLTTVWIDGEKLSESRAADVRELCNTLLSSYLIQLLDTGLLHADPHPGNLIRTADGKICVLDFGLMTEVTPEQRIALVEYIAHLTTQDWENVARDLQTLGFIPADAGDPVELGMAEPLGRILIQLSGGGGATKLNIDAVMSELEQLGSRYPFRIPPFFALILRAFSVIEGIALAVDPDYSIVQECFPYLSRRLLADDDPRVRKALRDVLYGGKTRLDIDRLLRLSEAFSAYTTDGLAADASSTLQQQQPQQQQLQPASSSQPAALSPVAKDALLVVFSKKGSYVQELLVEELVAAVDALSREALSETLRLVLRSTPAVLAMSGLEALGPFRPLLVPFLTPVELLTRFAPAVELTAEDQEALGVVRGVFRLVQQAQLAAAGNNGVTISTGDNANSSSSSGSSAGYNTVGAAGSGMVFSSTSEGRTAAPGLGLGAQGYRGSSATQSTAAAAIEAVTGAASIASELRPLLPELLPGIQHTSELFLRTFAERVATRLAESFAPGGAVSNAGMDEAETQMTMAALGFMSRDQQTGGLLSSASKGSTGSVRTPSLTSNGFVASVDPLNAHSRFRQQQQWQTGNVALHPLLSASSFVGSGSGTAVDGVVPAAANSLSDASSSDGLGLKGHVSPGQVVVGLLAAPLMIGLAPLALLSEMQRRQPRQ